MIEELVSDENIMRIYMRKAEQLQEICEFIETVMKAKAKKEPQSVVKALSGKRKYLHI